MDELRIHRLEGLKIRLKQQIINHRHVYLSTVELQHTWATQEEVVAIANQLVLEGFCVLIKGSKGAGKLMLPSDEARREQAASNG